MGHRVESPEVSPVRQGAPTVSVPYLIRPKLDGNTVSTNCHVYFMYISCCLCTFFRVGNAKFSRRKGRFQWNTGFKVDTHNSVVMKLSVSDIVKILYVLLWDFNFCTVVLFLQSSHREVLMTLMKKHCILLLFKNVFLLRRR